MLNKKAQVEDTVEIIVVVILLIIGVTFLYFIKAGHAISLESAKESFFTSENRIQSVDARFMGTDLTNTLKLDITDDKTVGEIIALTVGGDVQSLLDQGYLDETMFTDRLFCDDKMKDIMIDFLSPVYGDEWFIKVYDGDDMVFICYDAGLQWGDVVDAEITLPSADPSTTLLVQMEVRV
jgi:hypothetical protein